MVEEALVDSQISDSITLVKSLESQGDKPSAVVWHYFADAGEWRLLLAGPTYDRLLPKDESLAYQKVAEAFGDAQVASLTVGEVKIVRTDDVLLQAMRLLIRTGPDAIVRAHFKDNRINSVFLKEVWVLRLD